MTPLREALDGIDEVRHRLEKLGNTAMYILELQGAEGDSSQGSFEHFAYELSSHARKLNELHDAAWNRACELERRFAALEALAGRAAA